MKAVCKYCGGTGEFVCETLMQASRCSTKQFLTKLTELTKPIEEENEYEGLTDFDWIQYELATIFYDYRVSTEAQNAIIRCIRNYLHE
jgi:hypothetical protein